METIIIGAILIVLIAFGSVRDYRFDRKVKSLTREIKTEREIVQREHNKTTSFTKL